MRPLTSSLLVVLSACSLERAAGAQSSADPRAMDRGAPAAPEARTSTGGFGVGGAYFGSGRSGAVPQSYDNYGLVLGYERRFYVSENEGINVGLGWAFTEFQRTEYLWDAAYRAGDWTTTAYGDVYRWSAGGSKDTRGFRVLGSWFAYAGLIFPYAFAGFLYLIGPFASSTFWQLDATLSHHLEASHHGMYVEAGLGGLAFIHPERVALRGGIGLSGGAGWDFDGVGLGARFLWSPPHLHGEVGSAPANVFTGTLVVRFRP